MQDRDLACIKANGGWLGIAALARANGVRSGLGERDGAFSLRENRGCPFQARALRLVAARLGGAPPTFQATRLPALPEVSSQRYQGLRQHTPLAQPLIRRLRCEAGRARN